MKRINCVNNMKYFEDLSTTDKFPKTLLIRNTVDGLIWQIYHVQNETEANNLSRNAKSNGFYGITLEDFDSELKETWPNWRENCDPEIFIDNED
jgi:hypothetical protein